MELIWTWNEPVVTSSQIHVSMWEGKSVHRYHIALKPVPTTHGNKLFMWILNNCKNCDEEMCWECNHKYIQQNLFIYFLSNYRLHRGLLTTIAWNDCHNRLSNGNLFCGGKNAEMCQEIEGVNCCSFAFNNLNFTQTKVNWAGTCVSAKELCSLAMPCWWLVFSAANDVLAWQLLWCLVQPMMS